MDGFAEGMDELELVTNAGVVSAKRVVRGVMPTAAVSTLTACGADGVLPAPATTPTSSGS